MIQNSEIQTLDPIQQQTPDLTPAECRPDIVVQAVERGPHLPECLAEMLLRPRYRKKIVAEYDFRILHSNAALPQRESDRRVSVPRICQSDERERERERESVCVCVCVCVKERERPDLVVEAVECIPHLPKRLAKMLLRIQPHACHLCVV